MIDIICIRGNGDKEAPSINDPLIQDEHIAVKRGTNFINDNWYKVKSRVLEVPYKDEIDVDAIASVYETNLGLVGNHIITAHSFSISQEGIVSNVSIEEYEDND